MNREEIIQLFPVKVQVTQKMIDEGSKNLSDSSACIGAIALKSVLSEEFKDRVHWAFTIGVIFLIPDVKEGRIRIMTEELLSMTEITEPIEITFKVIDGGRE